MKKMDNLRIRKVQVNVKGTLIEYDEYYLVDDNKESLKKELRRPIVKLDENGGGYDEENK